MINECCTNEVCVHKETQLRLARLREDLLTNFNSLLIDRIRFLEQTISDLSSSSSKTIPTPVLPSDKLLPPEIVITDRLTVPLSLRRSTSATAYFLQRPDDPNLLESVTNIRSCPSSGDLSTNNEKQKYFLSIKTPFSTKDTTLFGGSTNCLSTPIKHRQWACSTSDLPSSNNEKGRLETRRFACDVDDNDVRAFKAMVYMEQARKQNARPLTRLRQALGISSNSSNTANFTSYNSKKQTNS